LPILGFLGCNHVLLFLFQTGGRVAGKTIAFPTWGKILTTIASGPVDAALTPLAIPATDFSSFGRGPRGFVRACGSFLGVLTLTLIGIQFILTMYHPTMDDPDVWWHMRNAEYLLQSHHLARSDMYSFTVAGRPWINTEWLSEIPFYLAYRGFGLVGIQTLTFLLPTTIFLLLLRLCYKESLNFKASILACAFATFLAKVSYGPRTILFGYVFMVVLLSFLQAFRDERRAVLWFLPPLFLVWVNTHGSWALGLILFFLVAVSGFVEGRWGLVESRRWTRSETKQLILSGAASVGALFINPYGWRAVWYPFDLALNQKLNIAHVQEWTPVNFQDMRGKLVLVLIVALLLGALLRSRRWNLGELLILLFAMYTALVHIRFLVLLGIVMAPVLAKILDFFPRYHPELETPRVNLAVIACTVAAMVFLWPHNSQLEKSLNKTYPAGAVAFMQSHGIHANVLNFYLWGGYLDWHSRQTKIFVDSRVDIFEYAGVLFDYLHFLEADSLDENPAPLLGKYRINYVLFPPSKNSNKNLDGGGLMYILEHDPKWKVLYRDEVSELLQRVDPISEAKH
jgi:hypothetical protein